MQKDNPASYVDGSWWKGQMDQIARCPAADKLDNEEGLQKADVEISGRETDIKR